MARTATIRPEDLDLTSCDREPIHHPGSIQPFGILLVLDEALGTILQVSANIRETLGKEPESVLGQTLDGVFGAGPGKQIRDWLAHPSLDHEPLYLGAVDLGSRGGPRTFGAISHRIDGVLILEFEEMGSLEPLTFPNLYPLIRTSVASMERAATIEDLGRLAVEEVRRITGFERVLIYRFDEDGNGTVIAEERDGDALPSYLHHRFPATDIPKQARELYKKNRLRLIVDANYTPVPLIPANNPRTRRPLDLTFSGLRSVSQVHVEYMRNMKTAASMSISILRDGQLWGLISCHHSTPRMVSFEVRTACDFLGQVLSLQMAAKLHNAEYEYRIKLKSTQTKLLELMAKEDDFVADLAKNSQTLLDLASADGAAIVFAGKCTRLGLTPEEPEVLRLVNWLSSEAARPDVYSTESLPGVIPDADAYKDKACGLLAISISKLHRSYLLWFRPEVLTTVEWGGDPRKAHEETGGRIHPRKSFADWREIVRLRCLPWRQSELDTAAEFRNAVVGIVLRKAEELAELSAELKRSNRELEAFSYSVSHDLRAPFRHILGYSELLLEEPLSDTGRRFASTIIESAQYAGILVDNLLAFSHMGRTAIHPVTCDMNQLVEEARRDVMSEAEGRNVRWTIGDLPEVFCDPIMMRLAVRNLLSNALKFTRGRDEAVVEVGSEARDGETLFFVKDNGTGFDMKYVDKLFGVFQRLHRMEEYEGTGIGLANVRRIVERHGGKAWAEGLLDVGATFFFTLPDAVASGRDDLAQADEE